MIARAVALALAGALLASSSAIAAPRAGTGPAPVVVPMTHAPRLPPGVTFRPRCPDHSCQSVVAVDPDGKIHADAAPNGFGPPDLQSAYNIDPSLGSGLTIAIVDAFGYGDLESDLAVYRSTFGLPPCTIASGCLTLVNDNGEASPLPAEDASWIGETALDVDMVSAVCPQCKIVVIQCSAAGVGLFLGQRVAAKLGVDAISDSWGAAETNNIAEEDGNFNNPGVATFAGTGDNGYNGPGAFYPSTSTFVVGVGGTHLAQVDPSVNPRGWVETAWSDAGSSCSSMIAKPAYQPAYAACTMRASADVSAVADPATGLATYIAKQGGWSVIGGTSAATPIVTGSFAAAGHGDATPAFMYKHAAIFHDITQGGNGSCGTNICTAGTGWDGPTGLGTFDQAMIKAIGGVAGNGPTVAITYPADGDTVAAGFTVEATPGDSTAYITIDIDGVKVAALDAMPYQTSAPTTLADGAHAITVTAFDIDHNSQSAMINVTQSATTMPGDDAGSGHGCAAGGSSGGAALAALSLGLALTRRRRRA